MRAGERPTGAADGNGRRSARVGLRFRRSEEGSAIVEFALVAPMFFFLMFVIAQTAMVFIAEQVLDNAVFTAARLIRTGQAQNGNFDKADFKEEICRHASVFIDCDSDAFYLDVRSTSSFSAFGNLSLASPLDEDENFDDDTAYQAGGPSSIVIVRAYYQWPTSPIFGELSLSNMANGKRLIGAFAAFRSEPYKERD